VKLCEVHLVCFCENCGLELPTVLSTSGRVTSGQASVTQTVQVQPCEFCIQTAVQTAVQQAREEAGGQSES
jgi:hypothetical protein